MTELMLYLLGTLGRGIIIFLLLLAVENFLRTKTGFLRNGFYYLLLLVLIAPFAIFSFHSIPLPAAMTMVSETPAAVAAVSAGSPAAADLAVRNAETGSIPVEPARMAAYLKCFDWSMIGGTVYLISVVLIVVGKLVRWRRWQRLLNSCQEVEDGRLQQLFALARKLAGMDRWDISLVDGSGLSSSPACYGCRRARILFPAAESDFRSDQEIIMLLMHELAHIRRRDYPVRLLLDFAASFYWFNPVFRLLHFRLLQAQEVSCDALVVERLRLSSDGRRCYARLLFEFAAGSSWEKGLPVPGLSRKGQILKKRVLEILSDYRASGILLPLLLFSLIALAGMLTPVWDPAEELAQPVAFTTEPAEELAQPAAFTPEPAGNIFKVGRLALPALSVLKTEPSGGNGASGTGNDFRDDSETESAAAGVPAEIAGTVPGLDYYFDLASAWQERKEKLRRTVDYERIRATTRYLNSGRAPVERLREERKIMAIAGRIAWKEPDRLIALARERNDYQLAEQIEREAMELLGRRI